MTRQDEEHRRRWAGAVAKLVYPLDPPRCAKALVDYLPLLADLPTEAFTPASAEAVALAERRMAFPSYDEIAKPLRAWWKENRPVPAMIAWQAKEAPHYDPGQGFTREDMERGGYHREVIAEILARRATSKAAGRAGDK